MASTGSCSANPLSDLSKHFFSSSSSKADLLPSTSNPSSSPSFRSRSTVHSKIDSDLTWASFARSAFIPSSLATKRVPTCQIEAVPPSFTYPLPMSQPPLLTVSSFDVSPMWSPEQETQHVLGSPSSIISFASSYNVPSDDEAASISTTPSSSYVASSSFHELHRSMSRTSSLCQDDNDSRSSSPHPVTFTPPSHTAWDFDKLFGGRRRWYGGVRIPNEEFANEIEEFEEHQLDTTDRGRQTEGKVTAAQVMFDRMDRQDRERSVERRIAALPTIAAERPRSISRSRLCNEILETSSANADADMMRQKEVYDRLQASAKERLGLISRHLDWE